MPTIHIRPQQLANALKREGKRVGKAIMMGSYRAAQRLKAHVANAIDEKGITDQGILKNSLRVVKTATGASLTTDAPHAGVVELGARPHKVGPVARAAIAAWCVRKLGLDPKDAARAAYFIGLKIEREGQKPTYVFRDSIPAGRTFFAEEVVKILNSRSDQSVAA